MNKLILISTLMSHGSGEVFIRSNNRSVKHNATATEAERSTQPNDPKHKIMLDQESPSRELIERNKGNVFNGCS